MGFFCWRTAVRLAASAFGLLFVGANALTHVRAAGAQIVFLAGPKDHGRPGRHEYEKDLRVLASGLENSPDLAGAGVTTRVFVGSAPRDLNEFRDAAAIAIESSSDRWERETHPLFPPAPLTNYRSYDDETAAWLKSLDELIKQQRIGIVIFHYATWVENWTARGYYVNWTGGLWVQMISRNPVDQWSMTLESPEHPILRGVKPWTYRDEVFCRFHLPNDSRRTNLLLATPSEDKFKIGPQIAAWAYEREDGGRSFVFGGVDFHDGMAVEDYRKFLLNGIVWAARLDVPESGVSSTLPPEFQASEAAAGP